MKPGAPLDDPINLAKDVPTTQFLSVPGGAVAYDDTGAGPVVICVPGIGDVRAEYRFLRAQLVAAGFRVVTMDLRGHGESTTGFADYSAAAIGSDMIALARHLDRGPVAVIGTSKAGGAAVWAAAQAPNLINRLVLIGPFVRRHGGDALLKVLMRLLLARPWGSAMWSMYLPTLYPSRKPADFTGYRGYLRANLRQPGRLEAVKAMMLSTDPAIERCLDQVGARTLVVMGSKDPDFKDPAWEARWIADKLHGSQLTVEGAGHYPHAEMPDETGPEIVRFLSPESGHAA